MLFIAKTLNYSESYKRNLIDEIESMIEQEQHSIDYNSANQSEPDYDSAGFSMLDREQPTEADYWNGDESYKSLQ